MGCADRNEYWYDPRHDDVAWELRQRLRKAVTWAANNHNPDWDYVGKLAEKLQHYLQKSERKFEVSLTLSERFRRDRLLECSRRDRNSHHDRCMRSNKPDPGRTDRDRPSSSSLLSIYLPSNTQDTREQYDSRQHSRVEDRHPEHDKRDHGRTDHDRRQHEVKIKQSESEQSRTSSKSTKSSETSLHEQKPSQRTIDICNDLPLEVQMVLPTPRHGRTLPTYMQTVQKTQTIPLAALSADLVAVDVSTPGLVAADVEIPGQAELAPEDSLNIVNASVVPADQDRSPSCNLEYPYGTQGTNTSDLVVDPLLTLPREGCG